MGLVKLSEVTNPISTRPYQILQSEIKPQGSYPVISQGKQLIEGYSDNKSRVLSHQSPLLIFGDHTKNLKFVDFDFIVGADGTKILSPIIILPKYLYFALLHCINNLPTRNYGRHFKYLNLMYFPLPPMLEQHRIVDILETILPFIDQLEKYEKQLDALEKEYPEQLKKSLLQAAMQGKLTEQLSEDGDAKDLLAEIQQEKKRKIKAGEIKAAKLLPPIDPDEIPYEIPENWIWTRIGEITNYGDTNQINKTDIKQGSWILELEDIEKNTTRIISIRTDRIAGSSKLIFNAGDILYGKLRPYLRKVIVATKPGYCSSEIIPFKGYRDINSHFLKYYMLSPYATLSINSQTFGTKMPRAGTDQVRSVQIPLPPLDEQQRIVSVLDKLLPLSEGLRQP